MISQSKNTKYHIKIAGDSIDSASKTKNNLEIYSPVTVYQSNVISPQTEDNKFF